MREIKFRQWYDREMRYLDNVFVGVGQIGFSDTDWVDLGNHDEEHTGIMQYTGLKDKNGKEIYEGDIVRLTTKTGGDIDRLCEWDYRVNGWRFQGFNYSGDDQRIIEVIGNIYENPELLKERH